MLKTTWITVFAALGMAIGCAAETAPDVDSSRSELSVAPVTTTVSRWIGPLDPKRPGGDGFCHDHEIGCGDGCCLSIERCFDGQCFIKEEGDDLISR